MKTKSFQNLKISELNQCQCQTNLRIWLMSESDNVRRPESDNIVIKKQIISKK